MAIKLDPGRGGRCILESALQTADIIVSTTGAAVSGAIRVATWSDVSHAALYIGAGQVVEAIGQGVVMRPLSQSLQDDTLAVAYRRPGITPMQALQVRDFVGRQLGKGYNYAGVGSQGLGRVPTNGTRVARMVADVVGQGQDRFFCSQLVLAAFADAGIPLDNTSPYRSSPNMIPAMEVSGRLMYVGHLKV